jgi:hypothetical protein
MRLALSSRAGESGVLRRSGARRELFDGSKIVHCDAAQIAFFLFFLFIVVVGVALRRRRPLDATVAIFSRLFFCFRPPPSLPFRAPLPPSRGGRAFSAL